jgi:hypothetical protein
MFPAVRLASDPEFEKLIAMMLTEGGSSIFHIPFSMACMPGVGSLESILISWLGEITLDDSTPDEIKGELTELLGCV